MDGVSPFDQKESNIIKFFQKRACVNDPFVVVYRHWGISAVGSAFEWHSKGRGFESHMLHFFFLQIWFIGRTLASQAGKAGSTPVICCIRPLIVVERSNNYKGFFHLLFPACLPSWVSLQLPAHKKASRCTIQRKAFLHIGGDFQSYFLNFVRDTTRAVQPTRPMTLGRTMSWLNISDRAHTRSEELVVPRKIKIREMIV